MDSVDVVFHRLFAKARLSRDAADHQQAGVVKRDELAVYAKADAVLTVTEADRQVLLTEVTGLHVAIVPNIHPIPPRRVPDRAIAETLIFVGAFRHEPNVDAMIYFCHEVLPLIRAQRPGVRLRIVGGMKGKIGEAMAHGLPVVTTSSGIEGFGLSPRENVLVGDTPQSIAQAALTRSLR